MQWRVERDLCFGVYYTYIAFMYLYVRWPLCAYFYLYFYFYLYSHSVALGGQGGIWSLIKFVGNFVYLIAPSGGWRWCSVVGRCACTSSEYGIPWWHAHTPFYSSTTCTEY